MTSKLLLVEKKILELTQKFDMNWERIYPHDLYILGDVSPMAFQSKIPEISDKKFVIFREACFKDGVKVYRPKLCVYDEKTKRIIYVFPHSYYVFAVYEFLLHNIFPDMERFFDSILAINSD